MTRYLAFLIMPLLFVACQEHEQTRPNFIFIFSDDHALKAISAYDSTLIRTPSIDRLAREGMLFSHCFCANSICAPSRATVLTGQYSHINGVRDNGDSFDTSLVTFPKLLRQSGYQTALIGKWHLKTTPTGFDYWEVLPGQGDYYNPTFISGKDTVRSEGYVTRIITEKSLEWLDGREDGKPFILMVQHKAPHRNWMPEAEKVTEYSGKMFPVPPSLFEDPVPGTPRASMEMSIARHMFMDYDLKVPSELLQDNDPEREPARPEWWAWERQKLAPYQQKAWDEAMQYRAEEYLMGNYSGDKLVAWKYQQYMRDYLACIETLDEGIGELLQYLDDHGLTDNTVVIYSSDQGFYLGEHGWYDKRWMYEESLHMPLLVRYPEEVSPGRISEEMAQNIDFAPTLLDYAGVQVPESMQGLSLRGVLSSQLQGPLRNAVYYHYYEYPGTHNVMRHDGIRTERYKLIRFYEQDLWELYDLEEDPEEMYNLVSDYEYSHVFDSLKLELIRKRNEAGDIH